MCCLLPVQKRMGFHTRAWQNSTSPPVSFLLFSCRNTSIFWGSGWEQFPSLKVSAHKNTKQKPLQFGDLYYIFAASLPGKIRHLWQCFWHLPPRSSLRHGTLRGIFMNHVLLKWYWSVCTQLKEDVYEGARGNILKNQMCHAQWKATGRYILQPWISIS